MIVITGAGGQLGSRIVEQLLSLAPAEQVGVSVRDVAQAKRFADRGVRVRRGDFLEPETLSHAFEGADQVLIVSASIRGAAAVPANRAAIDAARSAGARRILYTSHQAASHHSLFAPQLTHAATEDHLAAAGVPFTSLRNGFYATTLGFYLGAAVETGRLVVPEDGPFSWTAHDDLAGVAAAALASEGLFDGATPPLTAPDMLDFAAVAEQASEVAGRMIEHVVVGDDDWKASAVAAGMPEAAAEFTLGMFRAARRGEFAVTDPTLEKVLGRPAIPARQVIEDLLAPR
ncbi:NAD(P)H-binding protein [Actinoplanes sp. LDG1-06]|uniref:NAD(P)H-binding protein n=1 Tax=Paractinoplanes ovalisporus TaxID=2810368 RepID=A0ABS2A817_9ACTN|nr:NAD(P)H-binding protein [Actinoplanes ovalisporus]MBM2615986.1 NAD(P)H-binding protein [Actinoplanes ovalisporus]